VFLGWGWRIRLPDMVGRCEYTAITVTDSREGVVLKLRGWEGG